MLAARSASQALTDALVSGHSCLGENTNGGNR